MGSELQGKYQKLAQEYAKLRSHVDILKKAVKDEQAQRTSLEESLRERTLSLRKHVQENESLEFRNQQLSKRVAFLQEEASSPAKNKKKKNAPDGYGFPSGVSEVHTQELAAKISENERLHMKLLEVTQKSERKISGMESKIVKLEQEVSTHLVAVDEINREHELQAESIRTEKAMLEAKLAAQSSELETLRKAMEKHLMVAKEEQQNVSASSGPQRVSLLEPNTSSSYDALNVPVVDTKLQAEVLKVLVGGVELLTTFTTQMSTFHSYLEQRCKAYPVDTATGHPMSVVNQKLCELLHSSSSFTKPLVSTLTFYHKKLESNPYPQTGISDLQDFASTHSKFVVYLETITPYLQLSLQEECLESVCGPQLTERNLQLSQAFPCLTGAFTSLNSYLSLAIGGFSGCVHPGNMAVCLENLQQCLKDIQHSLNEISSHFSSKIAQEYQLPTASQKLNTTNECIASSLAGLHATVEQFGGFLESNSELFSAALEQNSLAAENKQSSGSSVVQRLRVRASDYIRRVQKECPESVPYTLAIYNARCLSSSSESRDTLMKQVIANQEKLSRLEQEKEQLILDVQLLRVKYEKEQKKVASMDVELAQLRGHTSVTPMSAQTSLNTSRSSLASNPPQLRAISESMGSLNTLSDGNEEEPSDDAVREELIRKHFATRIAELSGQLQEGDSKAAHYYAECRTLHKQLNHSVALRNKIAQDLQISTETIQQLQDQLTTTSSNYERQLSTMSDHLCELNDKLLKQSDEMELLRKSKGKRWGKNKD